MASSINNTNIEPTSYIRTSPVHSLVISPLNGGQVLKQFAALDGSKASLDIPNNLIKMSTPIIAPVFTQIHNKSIEVGIVPDI